MEINNFYQSSSSIYMQLAQKKVELADVEKEKTEKSTQDTYNETNPSNTKYDEKDYATVKLSQLQDVSTAQDELSSADAQIARTANLNRLFLESQGANNEN